MDVIEGAQARGDGGVSYDGFISYSHAADDLLAPRLQSALQRFAKPWWQRRAVRIFRDESSLSANPHLWSSISEALDTSGWFVLLLSPDAARSEWVNQEIAYWVENRDPKKILPVVTDGTFGWQGGDITGDAVPDALRGVFTEEPRWVDVRWAKDEDQLDLQDPRFADAVADIASTIRGIPKDDLASEEVRQHRRTVRTAWAAGIALLALSVIAVGASIQSSRNADEAERLANAEASARAEAEQLATSEAEARAEAEEAARLEAEARSLADTNAQLARARELAASAIGRLDEDPELATLLAIEAIDLTPEGVEQPAEVVNALWRAGQASRLEAVIDTGHETGAFLALSDDGRRLAVSSEEGAFVSLYDAQTLDELWTYREDTVDSFTFPAITSDGSRVAVSVIDSETAAAVREVGDALDDLPNRTIVFDGESGSIVHRLEYPECPSAELIQWSPDGRFLVVSSGFEGCERNGSRHWAEVFETDTWEPVAFLPSPGDVDGGPLPRFDASGALYLFLPFQPVEMYAANTFEKLPNPGGSGIGDVSPDGTRIVGGYTENDVSFGLTVFDTETSGRIDVLNPLQARPFAPSGVEISGDSRYVAAMSEARDTVVFDLYSGEVAFRLPGGQAAVGAFELEGERLFTAHLDGKVRVWGLGAGATGIETIDDLGDTPWVNGNSIRTGGDLGAAVSINLSTGTWLVRFFDLESGEFVGVRAGYSGDPAGSGKFAVLTAEGPVVLFDPLTGEDKVLIGCVSEDDLGTCRDTGETFPYHYPALSSDSEQFVIFEGSGSGFMTGRYFEVDTDTGLLGPPESARVESLREIWAYGDDWVLGRQSGSLWAVDRTTGEIVWEGVATPNFELSPSRKLGAFYQPGVALSVIELGEWDQIDIPINVSRARGYGFSPDESRVALSDNEFVYIIDIEARAVAQVFELAGVSDFHWLDSETLLIGTNSGIWGSVSLDTESFLESTRQGLLRSFTKSECDLYRIDPCPTLEDLKGG